MDNVGYDEGEQTVLLPTTHTHTIQRSFDTSQIVTLENGTLSAAKILELPVAHNQRRLL